MMRGRVIDHAISPSLSTRSTRALMGDTPNKGAFEADIPADAVEEALRSVEKAERRKGAAAPEIPAGEPAPVEVGEPEPAPEGDPRVRSLEAQLELSQVRSRETMDRLKEAHDRYVRAVADLENYKKRASRERDEVLKYGNEKLLKDLLPVADGLDRALASAAADDPMAKGVGLVRASLEQTLARHGVVGFSALGQPFDPARHEALLQVPTADRAPGTVVVEHARGFLLNDRLVRPAMVGVASAPPPAGEGEGEGGAR
jgi:molecular chaperone GrpE